MSGPKAEDRPRLILEDAISALCAAEEHCRCAALRLTNRMRTQDEVEILTEINAGRAALIRAKSYLGQLHPNGTLQ